MAATGAVSLQATVIGTPGGQEAISLAESMAAANYQVQTLCLASGDNTFTLPTSPAPTMCIIVLPSANAVVTKFKGAAGDTGMTIKPTGWMIIPFNTASLPTSIVLNSAAPGHTAGQITAVYFI